MLLKQFSFYEATTLLNTFKCKEDSSPISEDWISHPDMRIYNTSYFHPGISKSSQKDANLFDAIMSIRNSQSHPGVKYKKTDARMTILSFVSLPSDILQEMIPEMTDEEVEYCTKLAEYYYVSENTDLYTSALTKLKNHAWNKKEIERARNFLLASKESIVEELGVEEDDVLFYSIQFDTLVPQLWLIVLPTTIEVCDKDTFSRTMSDGTQTLLFSAGEKVRSYSLVRFYRKDLRDEYILCPSFYRNVVKRMAEKGINATGLFNGIKTGIFSEEAYAALNRDEQFHKSLYLHSLEQRIQEMQDESDRTIALLKQENREISSLLDHTKKELVYAQTEVIFTKNDARKATALLMERNLAFASQEAELSLERQKVRQRDQTIKEMKLELEKIRQQPDEAE